jgi:hypothetical protein
LVAVQLPGKKKYSVNNVYAKIRRSMYLY